MSAPLAPVDYLSSKVDSEAAIEFYASFETASVNPFINSIPSSSNETRRKISDAAKSVRTELEKNPAAKEFLTEFRKAVEDAKPSFQGKSVWKMPAEFNSLYKQWVDLRKKHKLPVPKELPDVEVENFESDYLTVQREIFNKALTELKVPSPLPDGSVPINPLVFPENLDDTTQELICKFVIQQAITAGYKPLSDDMKKIRDEYFKSHGLTLLTDVGFDKVIWEDFDKETAAEMNYVLLNSHYSNDFKVKVDAMKEKLKEGDKLPREIRKMEWIIKKRLEDAAAASKDGDGGKGDAAESSGTGKNSKWAAVIAKAAGIAMKGKDDEVIEMPVFKAKIPDMGYQKFVRQTRVVTTVPTADETAFTNFARRPLPGRIALASTSERIRQLRFDCISVVVYIRDNKLDSTDMHDVIYAAIIAQLVSIRAIVSNDATVVPNIATVAARTDQDGQVVVDPDTITQDEVDKVITQGRLNMYGSMARRMLDVSFYYASQGATDGTLKWLESFNKVCGKVTSEKRFITICEMIIASGKLKDYCKELTIGDIHRASDVLKYRLMRISSASLIFRALRLITNDFVFRMIEPLPLREYYRFYKAGVLGQIAAGPLRVYLDGQYNPLLIDNIPHDVPVGDLMPIPVPPYNERLIKQAKTILDVYGVEYGRWYQGERASTTLDTRDMYFKEVVKAIKTVDADRVKNIAEAIAAEMNIADFGNDKVVEDVKGYVETYGIGLEVDPEA